MARSRLMAKLDAAIAAAANPIEAKCLRAERAGLLARQGQLEAARTQIDELNAQLAWQPNLPLRAWLALADGLHVHYSALDRGAQTSIEQAYMLAQATESLTRLHALAAAWLANLASGAAGHRASTTICSTTCARLSGCSRQRANTLGYGWFTPPAHLSTAMRRRTPAGRRICLSRSAPTA